MVGQLYGNHVLNFMQLRDKPDFGINRIGFNHRNNPAVRQHAMHFDTIKGRDTARNSFSAPIETTDNHP